MDTPNANRKASEDDCLIVLKYMVRNHFLARHRNGLVEFLTHTTDYIIMLEDSLAEATTQRKRKKLAAELAENRALARELEEEISATLITGAKI